MLRNQQVVVIGGSSGMGRAVARAAVAAGARVIIAARDEAKLAHAAADIGGAITTRRLDITDEGAVAAFFESTGGQNFFVERAVYGGPNRTSGHASTGTPWAARRLTSAITGDCAAMAPQRK